MFSGMSAITFATGLVAALCVTDVNAVVWETCRFTDHKCTNLIRGSCLAGLDQPEFDADDNDADESYGYKSRQKGYGYNPNYDFHSGRYGVAPKDYKTCKKFAEAAWAAYSVDLTDDDHSTDDDLDDYSIQAALITAEDIFMHEVEAKVHCFGSTFTGGDGRPAPKGEFYGMRCGESSTGKVSIFVYVGIGAGGIILVIAIIFIYSKVKQKSGSSYNINSGNDSDPDNGGINGDDVTLLSFGNPNPSNSTTSGGNDEYE